MSENHFRSHFWPFQIDTQLNYFWNFLQNGCRWPFWMSEIHFRSHFWPFQIDFLLLQNGHRRPFWLSEMNFQSHFWPFQINTQLEILIFVIFFYKMAAGGCFGWPLSVAFLAILDQYRLFIFFIFTKWLPVAILDVRKSISISFLSISDWYATLLFFEFFYKMAAGGHFGCPKITFDLISIQFTSIRNFIYFFYFLQNGWRRPFWMSEFHFRSHFWPISDRYATLIFFGNFWQNGWRRPFWMSEIHFRSHFWPFQIDRPFWISEIHFRSQFWPFQIDTELFFPAAILDVWKSLWIAFLAISDGSVILDVRNSLSMAFLAISDPYGTLFIFLNFWQNGRRRPFWMSANNFWLPIQIDTQLFFLKSFDNMTLHAYIIQPNHLTDLGEPLLLQLSSHWPKGGLIYKSW